MSRDQLRVTVHQTAPHLAEVAPNEEDFRARIGESADSDLLVFPELSLTGYGLKSRVSRFATRIEDRSPVQLPPGCPPVAFGILERGEDELIYNTVLLATEKEILAKHRKVYLPTYGPFDEGRFFAPGRDAPPVVTLPGGWRVGLLVCEDFWHPSLLNLLALQEADVVLVLAAAPGRGEPALSDLDPEPGFRLFSSTATWTLLARTAAIQYGLFVVLANRAGVEEGISFAGESTIVGPDGTIIGRAPQAQEAVLDLTLGRGALRKARNPFAHLRDEDPGYLRRALDQLEGKA